jgi:flagellar biosynthesis/type III secretory pathway chaperone
MGYNTFGSFYGGHFHPKGLSYESELGFLIVMDLLGIKGIWKTPDFEKYFTKWSNINDFIDDSLNNIPADYSKYSFSDTIIITAKVEGYKNNNDLVEYIPKIGVVLSDIVQEAIKNELFFRGAISFGQYYKSPESVIGPAIDDAAICYEEPQLIGIIASKDFVGILNNLEKEYEFTPFIRYNVPLKEKLLNNWWLLRWNYNSNTTCLEILKAKEKQYSNNSFVKAKYSNTIIANS